jgi:hypothetical protein
LLIQQDHTDAAAMKTLVSPLSFVKSFPALRDLEIKWPFCSAEAAARIQEQLKVSAFGKDQSPQQGMNNSDLTALTIQARNAKDFKVSDEEKISQLGWILQGIVCPQLQWLSVQCRSFDKMHTESSWANWSRLVGILQRCRYPCLDRLHMVFHVEMNGHAIDKDLCVSLFQLVQERY